MRILRWLLLTVGSLLGLTVLLVGIAFSPPFQYWAARRLVVTCTGADAVQFSSVSLNLSSLAFEDLRLQRGTTIVGAPSVQVKLRVKDALLAKRIEVTSLVAKGWTIDASGESAKRSGGARSAVPTHEPSPDAAGESRPLTPVEWLKSVVIPGSWNGVDLEGDLIVRAGKETASVHLNLKGGDVAPGRVGSFVGDFTIDPAGTIPPLRAQGTLRITIARGGAVERAEFAGRAGAPGLRLPADLQVSAALGFVGAERTATYALGLRRGEREVGTFTLNPTDRSAQVRGTWSIDLREPDLALLGGALPVAVARATGRGAFEAENNFRTWQASGQLRASAVPVALRLPNPGALRAVTAEATFAVAHTSGEATRLSRFEADVAGEAPLAHVRLLQPIDVAANGSVHVTDTAADVLTAELKGLPLALVSRDSDALRFLGGALRGSVVLAADGPRLVLRSTAPVSASGVMLRTPYGTVSGLDATSSVIADSQPGKGWTIRLASCELAAAGRRFLTLDTTIDTAPDTYGRNPTKGTWTLELPASAASKGATRASGEFSGHLGLAGDLKVSFLLAGADPAHVLSGEVVTAVDDFSRFSFKVPVHLGTSTDGADLEVSGQCRADAGAVRLEAEIASQRVTMTQVDLLRALFPALDAKLSRAQATDADTEPFWGKLAGFIRLNIRQFSTKERDWWDAAGVLLLDPRSVQLSHAHVRYIPQPPKRTRSQVADTPLEPSSTYALDAAVTFDRTAPQPYRLNATATVDVLPTPRLLGGLSAKADAVIDGHWAVTDTITSAGGTLGALIANREDQLKLESSGGALRLLKTSIADAIPDEAAPMSDTLATIGSGVGRIFGHRGNTIAGQRKLPKETEALLNFTYTTKEFSFEKMSLTVRRDRDGTLRLTDIVVTALNERLTGSGTILYAPDRTIGARPMNLTLQLAFKGPPADHLVAANLLAPEKDAQGFRSLRQPVQFGGTLAAPDPHEWHDLLAKAATATLPPKK